MKKTIVSTGVFYAVLAAIACLLTACDSEYLGEKLAWNADKKASDTAAKGKPQDKDLEQMRSNYEKVVSEAPLTDAAARAQFEMAAIDVAQGRYNEAMQQYEEILKNYFSKPDVGSEALLGIAKLYQAKKNEKKALEYYTRIMTDYPISVLGMCMPAYLFQYYLANQQMDKAQAAYEEGVKHLTKQIDDYGESDVTPFLREQLAQLHALNQKFTEALAVLDTIIDNLPFSEPAGRAYLLKAQVYTEGLKEPEKAVELYQEFLRAFPRHPQKLQAKLDLSAVYYELGKIQEAITLYEQIKSENPDDEDAQVQARIGLFYCYKKLKETKTAMALLDELAAKYSDHPAAISLPFLRAEYYSDNGDKSSATKYYWEAVRKYKAVIEDNSASDFAKHEATGFLVFCYTSLDKRDEAIAYVDKLIADNPNDPQYLLQKATLYLNMRDVPKALVVYQQIKKQFAGNLIIEKMVDQQMGLVGSSLKETLDQ